MSDEDVRAIWEAYWADRTAPEHIDLLLRTYAHLAGYYARIALAKAPPHQDRDDILSYAQQGLLQAIERYEPNHGAKFETWAARIIPNRIKDGQRADDPLTRAMRGKVKLLEAARQQIEPDGPTSIEMLADLMKIGEEEVREILVFSQSLTAELDHEYDGHASESEGEVLVHMAQARAFIADRLAQMGPRQRAFALVYYCDTTDAEKTLIQACRDLEISPDWARQTRQQVLQGLQR